MRVKTVGSVSDFLNNRDCPPKPTKKRAASRQLNIKVGTGLAAGATAIAISNAKAKSVYASATETMPMDAIPAWSPIDSAKETIVEAFMPLVDAIQALSYPIALVMLTGGALMFMINQKERGVGLIQNASIGYILVQLMPIFMNLLVGIGGALA
ncbi:hypothetical protein [Shouchella miscanthi]|uniref:hypothetical protein n=1 Tax=Shouchella miscanthi TaxID=2598861 RepID=UPI0011A13153|nr:hypothetical protein [Shouchella miscanthi]